MAELAPRMSVAEATEFESRRLAPAVPGAAFSGAAWAYVSHALGKLGVFGTTLVLAHLLAVEDFGLVGYALVVVNFLDALTAFGVSSALISLVAKDDDEQARATAFALTVLSGSLLTLVTIIAAPVAGSFFSDPRAVELTRVMVLSPFVSSLGKTHDALLQKRLSFRKKLIPDLGQTVVKGVVSIVLASLGFGAWSLAWGQVAGAAASTVLSWCVFPWFPRRAFERAVAGRLLDVGGQLVGVNLLASVILNSDYLLVGRAMGAGPLGLYTLVFRIPDLSLTSLCWVLSRVLFPLFASLQTSPAALQRAYLSTVRYVAVALVPIGLGLVATAPALVRTLFGDKWAPAVPTMQLLALYSTVHLLTFQAGDLLKATGRGWVLMRLGLVSAGVLIPSMIIGLWWLGLPGVALGWIVSESVRMVLTVAELRGRFAIQPEQLWQRLGRPLLAGLGMLVLTWLIGAALDGPTWLVLVIQVLSGAALYAALILLLDRELVGIAVQLRRKGWARVRKLGEC